jgi:hypothetical protein
MELPRGVRHPLSHKERVGHKRWLAGKFLEEYRDRPSIEVNVGLGEPHLDALKAKGLPPSRAEQLPSASESEEADFEVVGEEEQS